MESFARSVASSELLHNFEIAFLGGCFLAVHPGELLVLLCVKHAIPAQTQTVVVLAAGLSSFFLESFPSAFVETGNGEIIVTECGAEVSFGFGEGLELDPADVITRCEGFHGARVHRGCVNSVVYQQFHRPVLIHNRLIHIQRQHFDFKHGWEIVHQTNGILVELIRDGIKFDCVTRDEWTFIVPCSYRILERILFHDCDSGDDFRIDIDLVTAERLDASIRQRWQSGTTPRSWTRLCQVSDFEGCGGCHAGALVVYLGVTHGSAGYGLESDYHA